MNLLVKRSRLHGKNAGYAVDICGLLIDGIVNKIVPLFKADKVL